MSAIQSSVGLITGIPIQQTVDQLMAISARPRDLLTSRTSLLESERLAVNQLSSLVLALQFEANALKPVSAFQTKRVTSSDTTALSATIRSGGSPRTGSYQFTPVQTASSQQLISNSFADVTSSFSQGALSFRFGGFVDEGIALSELNAGQGFQRGKIRITDRSGATSVIDLRFASTVDDVLHAINSNTDIQVTAATRGDAFTLTDTSGGTGSLVVQEISNGTTAASLGLAGVNTASDTATGSDVFTLHSGTQLSILGDGNGVQILAEGTADLSITFRDQSAAVEIDLAGSVTLGDVLDKLNQADPTRLAAAISSDGNRIELSDLTSGAGSFSVTSLNGGTAAEDLGIAQTTSGATLTSNRLVAGIRDVLVSTLKGGQGVGALGVVNITNRSGATFNVDLAAAETLGDVVETINSQTTGITAAINSQRHGILITDNTGDTASNLIIADGDAHKSAEILGILFDDAQNSVNSGTLNRQVISEATLLASLNNGTGVDSADIRITDSAGVRAAIDLNTLGNEATTVGEVIRRINDSNADVVARINDTGDGILIVDQAGGSGVLQVEEVGNGSAAADLGLLGTGADNGGTQQIDGAFTYSIDLTDLALEGSAVLLSSLNNGSGVDRGDFVIESAEFGGDGETPRSIAIDLDGADSDVLTVGQLIDRINTKATAAGVSIEAKISSSGTGIVLTDSSGGVGQLNVRDVGTDTAAADLGLLRTATTSGSSQTINGLPKFTSSDAAEAGLDILAQRINALDAGVTASTFFDGNGYRLSLVVDESGSGRELLIDTGDSTLSFAQVSSARDAILEVGTPGSGLLLTSSTNNFSNVIEAVDVVVNQAAEDPVRVDVSTDTAAIVGRVQEFVDAFNSIRANLDQVTSFNSEDASTGILFGTTAALRVDTDLSRVLGGRFSGLGRYDSLESVGIGFDDKGRLQFDKSKFEDALAEDSESLTRLFTDPVAGVAAKVVGATTALAANENSVLTARTDALSRVVEQNQQRITRLNERLVRERERLLLEFFRIEEVVASLQQSLTALQSIQVLPALTRSGNGASSLFGNR